MAESKNIQSDLIPKIATGFCAGISRTRGTCGAVTGAVMAINMFCGRNNPSVPLIQSYPPVQKFIKLFEERFGSTNCEQLIDCDLGTEEGRKKFLERKCQLRRASNYDESKPPGWPCAIIGEQAYDCDRKLTAFAG